MITVSIERRASRALEVRIKYNDSGVVIRMSDGSRWKRARTEAGVSPLRTTMAGLRNASPRDAATAEIPASGPLRLRSTSTARALSGDTYSTRHRCARGGGGE